MIWLLRLNFTAVCDPAESMYLANASIALRNVTVECNGRCLLVSRFARVLPATRERRSITVGSLVIVQFRAIPVQLPLPIVSAIVPRRFRDYLNALFFPSSDLHHSRIAVRSRGLASVCLTWRSVWSSPLDLRKRQLDRIFFSFTRHMLILNCGCEVSNCKSFYVVILIIFFF